MKYKKILSYHVDMDRRMRGKPRQRMDHARMIEQRDVFKPKIQDGRKEVRQRQNVLDTLKFTLASSRLELAITKRTKTLGTPVD